MYRLRSTQFGIHTPFSVINRKPITVINVSKITLNLIVDTDCDLRRQVRLYLYPYCIFWYEGHPSQANHVVCWMYVVHRPPLHTSDFIYVECAL